MRLTTAYTTGTTGADKGEQANTVTWSPRANSTRFS